MPENRDLRIAYARTILQYKLSLNLRYMTLLTYS
eukprot:CAMPEP_0172044840 /NCGR_PEP_ID=MMETSP1041-20130122/27012_1 /TAXON_ID=464988 /ORGANISM="Hemiselmis andersenii, Strain CCMP439" /LENGTH=33 /DNA_ID= /DNA_START= /DNA_END= /DNA_ORIENTATION=